MSLGSCFSENIGRKLQEACFNADLNPFGVLFNPVSINQSIERLIEAKPFNQDEFFKSGSLWNSFMHSSFFSDVRLEKAMQNVNLRFTEAVYFLRSTEVLIITFGTAWVYENINDGKIVSNCHKLPSKQFIRRRLEVQEIVEIYVKLINSIIVSKEFALNKIIFTVSPIRHWKDGAHENNLSKSVLHLAIDQIQKHFSFVEYFPAFEIQMDELRDYRFYANDMCHPSEQAIEFIWDRFSNTYFSEETIDLNKSIVNLRNQLNHKPLHPESSEYKLFLNNIEQQKVNLLNEFPELANRI